MTIPVAIVVPVLLAAAVFFFAAGSIGLIRFPDVYMRLHALTKSDNLGLGLIVLAVALYSRDGLVVLKLVLIEALVLLASATVSHLVAQSARQGGIKPWRKR